MNTQTKPSIILTGLPAEHPAIKAAGVTPEQIAIGVAKTQEAATAAGYLDLTVVWISPELGLDELKSKLREKKWHGVILGAGMRQLPGITLFLEETVNAIRETSPSTTILFNEGPHTNLEAAARCPM